MSLTGLPQKTLRLNIINKAKPSLKISLIAGTSLTISHLKRKIQTEYSQLYNLQIVIKTIEDSNGFMISNNSIVQQHFKNGDTIYFDVHREEEKEGSGMKLVANLGEILSTVKFMTASCLQKMDRIDLGLANVMEVVPEILHIGFWCTNHLIVQKLLKIFNKIFSESSIQTFLSHIPQTQLSLFLKIHTFWLCDTVSPLQQIPQISWQLLQLLQKFTMNPKFIQIVKNHKLSKTILELSKDTTASNQVKKICVRIVRNINGGGGRGVGSGLQKMRSEYMPSMLMGSNVGGFGVQDILQGLFSSSQDQKLSSLQQLSQNNFLLLQQATIRSDYYQKLLCIFTLRKIKTKKHTSMLQQCIIKLTQNTSKDQCIQIVQKDIFKKVHSFMLEMPVELHGAVLEYLSKICKVSSVGGVFNVEKGLEMLKSPYQGVVKIMVNSLVTMTQKLNTISSIRFLPGIRDYITLSLKSQSEPLSLSFLKILSNLSLDQQCRYQILNLKGIQVFVKFLQTSQNQQICRICAKGLLNLAISSRENKAKVIGAMNGIIQRFYRGDFDGVTYGFVETILKSKNI